MKRTDSRIRWCTGLLILNLLFIWGNSALPGELSDRLSQWVKDVIMLILPVQASDAQLGGHLLRKLAHFAEFACLGACLCWLAGMLEQTDFYTVLLPLSGAMVAACVDETIQRFVDGRNSSLIDVWIDMAGAATGIFLLLIGYHYLKKHKE